jgi:signal peptidase I
VDNPAAPESGSSLNGHGYQNGTAPQDSPASLEHPESNQVVPPTPEEPTVAEPASFGETPQPTIPDAGQEDQTVAQTDPSLGSFTSLPDSAFTDPTPTEPPFDITEDQPRSTLSEWTITILLLLFLTTTLVQAYVIPTGSMEDTLLIGDHLLVDKLAFAPPGPISKYLIPYTEVKRGDIIVFRYPADITQTFVKRAIGVPGDRIRVVNKEIYLNGVRLNEPYTYHKTDYIDSYRDNFPGDPNTHIEEGAYDMLNNHVKNGEVIVPPHFYFAMGDNRDQSLDSRYWGFVPRENIIGKPLIVYWSFDAPTDELNSSYISWRHIRDLVLNGFSKTRWKRTFMLIHGYPTGVGQAADAKPAHASDLPADLVSPPDAAPKN